MNDVSGTHENVVEFPRDPPPVYESIVVGDPRVSQFRNPMLNAIIIGAFEYLYPELENEVFSDVVETIKETVVDEDVDDWYAVIGVNTGIGGQTHDSMTDEDVPQYGEKAEAASEIFADTAVTTIWTISSDGEGVVMYTGAHPGEYQYHFPFTSAHLELESLTIEDLTPQTFSIIASDHVLRNMTEMMGDSLMRDERTLADMSIIAQAFHIHNTLYE